MDTTTISVIISFAAVALTVVLFAVRNIVRKRAVKAPAVPEFKVIGRKRKKPGTAQARRMPGRASTKAPGGGLDDLTITKNPNAYCLLTGKVARECRCDKHRSVK